MARCAGSASRCCSPPLGFGYQQWHAVQQVREFEELDLHLLSSDLPIDAYLDRGFQNWLRTAFDH